jgi:hypothetical protein
MNRLFCCASSHSVGCTFLDWSIHFLSGQNKFFSAKQNAWIDLVKNPLNTLNAHGHQKNHPIGVDSTKEFVEILSQQNSLTSYYPFPLNAESVAKRLGINSRLPTTEEWQNIFDYRNNDFNQLLKFSDQQQAKIIFVSLNEELFISASVPTRSMERMLFSPDVPTSLDDLRKEKDLLFFKDSVKTWNQMELNNIWDTRERLALSQPLKYVCPSKIDFSFEHYWLDSQSWWYNGKQEIKNIMNWIELLIDDDRYTQWIPIYEDWQQIQLKALRFQYNYQHIVDCVVNNWSYDIDLTFEQEVVIQHCLIYQHNLNLKTWQLEKFPNNTQDLHRLLEPNIHPLI